MSQNTLAIAVEPEIRVLDPVHVASGAPVSATLHPPPQFSSCMDNRKKYRPSISSSRSSGAFVQPDAPVGPEAS